MTSVLVNVAGFLLGAALYGLLLAMAAASRPAGDAGERGSRRWRERFERPLVWAGALGLIWNVGAFLAYGFPGADTATVMPLVMAVSFSALGFLPAVVVHVVMSRAARAGGRAARAATVAAYLLSAVAAGLQVQALVGRQPLPSRPALDLLTLGFLALLVPLVILTRRARHSRALWIVALALFGVSALHLTQHTGRDAWWIEVLGHQGSLLLPLAILLRDYRFAFADLFLKRALGLSLTVGLVAAVHLGLRRAYPELPATDASLAAYVLALTVLTALLQSRVQRAASWLIDKVVLGRADYDDVIADLDADLAAVTDEAGVLSRAARRIAGSLGSISVETIVLDAETPSARPVVLMDDAAAIATIPTVGPPYLAWRLGHLAGERRFLSDDIRVLEAAGSLVGRRIDSLRVAGERLTAAVRDQQISRLATEAELRALRAQIDPHFLFNALTTIAYLIRSSPAAAESTLLRLTSLLRAVLRRTRSEFTTLGEELDLIESYLDIERARFEERLHVTIDVPAALRQARIPSLLLQPLVENAIKHGIAPLAAGGSVAVVATAGRSVDGPRLRICVQDTGAGGSEAAWAHGRAAGVGLATLEQRLAGHFGTSASLAVDSREGVGTTVAVQLPLMPSATRPSELAAAG
jgi:two-component system LytT family sensor kinase